MDSRVEIITDKNDNPNRQRDLHDDHEIKSGDYWVNKKTNEIRLIRSLTVIDNILHSIKVLPHPSKTGHYSDNGSLRSTNSPIDFTLNEFLDAFMYIDQDEAKRVREKEIAKIQGEIQSCSEELAKGYISDEGTHANVLLDRASTQIKSDMSLPISMAKDNTVEQVKEKIEKTQEIADKQTVFIQEKTAVIAKKTNMMTLFYTEVAEQSLAAIDGTLVFVKKLQEGVKTLNIFLGEGVEVHTLIEGEPASNDEPLTFYQRKLFLDEEFFYHLSQGGADHRSLSAFREAIEKDISIIDTIAPSQKSVVLMQFRRSPKNYRSEFDNNIADAWKKVMDWQADQEMFLLVRNGKSVHMIFSEDIQGGKRLFPTASEINELFKDDKKSSRLFSGAEVDNYINFHDIRNAKARDTFDKRARYYQRIILMLNGIHSRTDTIFGSIKDEAYRDWLSLDFQKKYFKFVHDDEDALAYNTVSVSDFVKNQNRRIQAGSRVIGLWRLIANEDNAKGMWSNTTYSEPHKVWEPIDTLEPLLVEKDKEGLFVKVACKHYYGSSKNRNIKVRIEHHEYMLSIDYIKSEDVNYYLKSRHARASYVDFARLLIGARDYLKKEEKMAKGIIEVLKTHILNLYPELTEESIKKNIHEAVAFWRIVHKGKELPSEHEEGYSKMIQSVASIFYEKTLGNRTNEIKEFARSNIRGLLRISSNNKGRYYLYSLVDEEEHIPFGGYEVYPFVWKYTITFNKKGHHIEKKEQVLYKERYLGEDITHQERTYEIDRELQTLDVEYPSKIDAITKEIEKGTSLLKKLEQGGDEVDLMLSDYLDKKEKRQRDSRGRKILEYTMSIPMGIYLKYQVKSKDGYYYHADRQTLHLVEYYTNIDMLVAVYGSDALYQRLTTWIEKYYATPARTLATLDTVRSDKTSAFTIRNTQCYINQQNIPSVKSRYGFLVGAKTFFGNSIDVTQINSKEKVSFRQYFGKKKEDETEERYKLISCISY